MLNQKNIWNSNIDIKKHLVPNFYAVLQVMSGVSVLSRQSTVSLIGMASLEAQRSPETEYKLRKGAMIYY